MLAILDDGLETLFAEWEHRSRLWLETVEWIVSDDIQWPYSFRNICDALDVDPARLRGKLAAWLPAASQPTVGSLPRVRAIARSVRPGAPTAAVR